MSSTTWQFPRSITLRPLRRAAARRAQRWARKRQGSDKHITDLQSRRVYILPTGIGLVFGLTTFAMLLGSMNYNNNLSFVLTFLLISLGLISMHQCQRNLVGLRLAFAGVEPVFAGQSAEFRIAISNASKSHRYCLRIYDIENQSQCHDLAPGESRTFSLDVATQNRGYVRLPRFGVCTVFPFEFFRAWAWLHMDLKGIVYPRPASVVPVPPAVQTAQGHQQLDARGAEDFAALRVYQEGDSPRHVAWKAYARSGELLSKQFAGADLSSQWFDYESISNRSVEARLSVLTRWIIDAEKKGLEFGMRIAGESFEPAVGIAQKHACLSYLATFNLTRKNHSEDRDHG